jgi:hypothetical protein
MTTSSINVLSRIRFMAPFCWSPITRSTALAISAHLISAA